MRVGAVTINFNASGTSRLLQHRLRIVHDLIRPGVLRAWELYPFLSRVRRRWSCCWRRRRCRLHAMPALPALPAAALPGVPAAPLALRPVGGHSAFSGAGAVMQMLTHNAHGVVDGTTYLVTQGVHGAGTIAGRFVEAKHGGCSQPAHGALFDLLFPDQVALGGALGVLHLCTRDASTCTQTLPGRQVAVYSSGARQRKL